MERNVDYTFGLNPRSGFSLSARAGYVVAPRVLLYAGGGYGEHSYRTIAAGNVAEDLVGGVDRTRSFILRGGAELALSKTVGVRLEF